MSGTPKQTPSPTAGDVLNDIHEIGEDPSGSENDSDDEVQHVVDVDVDVDVDASMSDDDYPINATPVVPETFPRRTHMKEDLRSSSYYRTMIVTPREKRMTSDIMTSYEYSEVTGIRTSQIEKGAYVFTDVSGLIDPHDMAVKELFDRRCPLTIIRQTGTFEQEEFSVNEMGFPADTRSPF